MPTTATITREEALARLVAFVGPAHAQLTGDAIRVGPASAEQIADVLRFANEHGLSVVPTGGGTKLGWGNPVAPEIFLSLAHMNCVCEHAWQDLTCTVQAGCTWSAMQAALARHGQMVALDPLWPDRATVGGVVSVSDSGSLRLRYGGLRDLIIGMTIVLADGTIAKTGGKVVKNVAGYDLHKLLTGSYGTLGVITEVNFRLHPVEQHARTFTASASDAASLAQPLRDLTHGQISASATQLRIGNRQCALDVRLCARPECFDDHAAYLRRIYGEHSISEVNGAVWQARQHLFVAEQVGEEFVTEGGGGFNPRITSSEPAAPLGSEGSSSGDSRSDLHSSAEPAGVTVVKVSMLPAEICPAADDLIQFAAAEAIDISLVAQGTGLMTIALAGKPVAVIAAVDRLRARLRPSGGSAVVLQAPDKPHGKVDLWDCQSDALPLMREIKRRFDPNRTLNPGRFVGGI